MKGTPLLKRLSRSNKNTKFTSPVIRKPLVSSPPKSANRAEAVKLQELIEKWKRVCRDALIELQTESSLEELANTLRFDIATIGPYDPVEDCFIERVSE
jgi:predicted GIY-YIG superfamily endonuclease